MGSDLNRGSSGSTSAKNGPAFKWACGMLMFKGNSLANKSKQKKMDDISEVKKKNIRKQIMRSLIILLQHVQIKIRRK